MTSNADVIDRWLDVIEDNATRIIGTSRSNTVWAEGNAVYSYGRHFPLAEAYRRKDGTTFYILNGDRYSVTTSQHQSAMRGAIGNRLHVIVPFSALDGAGIDRSSIDVLDVTDDQWIEHKRESASIGDVPKHARYRWRTNPCTLEPCPGAGRWIPGDGNLVSGTYHYHGGESVPIDPDADGLYRWTEGEHRLGASLFRARYSRQRPGRTCRGPFDVPTGPNTIYPTEACRHGMTRPHTIMVREAGTATFLSAFDQQEARPIYYLAQVTGTPESVAEAVEGLKPEAVREADRNSTPYVRQGDVFAVATDATTASIRQAGGTIYRRAWLTNPRGIDVSGPVVRTRDDLNALRRVIALEGTNHQASMVAKMPDGTTLARGCLYHAPVGRGADHARRRILDGTTWAVVALNTVVRTFGIARAWSAMGRVD